MAFSEFELRLIDSTVGALCRSSISPEHMSELRFDYEVRGHTVTIWEERPPWDGRGTEWTSMGVARFKFSRPDSLWRLYWMRRDLEWHLYEPGLETQDLSRLVDIVEQDDCCAFFG